MTIENEMFFETNDLITLYLTEKAKNGYYPELTEKEFLPLLRYLKKYLTTIDDEVNYHQALYSYMNTNGKNKTTIKKGALTPNYNLTINDISNTSNKDEYIIKEIMRFYIKTVPQNNINKMDIASVDITSNIHKKSQQITAHMLVKIWQKYMEFYMPIIDWPVEHYNLLKCLQNETFFEEYDLLPIRPEFIRFFRNISKRISVLAKGDPNLKISSELNSLLAFYNYEYITSDFKKILNFLTDEYSKIEVDFNNFLFYTRERGHSGDTITRIEHCHNDELITFLDNAQTHGSRKEKKQQLKLTKKYL